MTPEEWQSSRPTGLFTSVLDWLGRPSQVVKNVLAGNLGGAGRQALDFLDAPVRAVIPGDHSNWEASGPEDFQTGSGLLGIDKQEHPILGTLADVGTDVLTDPLTYLSFGSTAAAKAIGESAQAASKLAEAANAAGDVDKAAQATRQATELAAKAKNLDGGVRLGVPFTNLKTAPMLGGQDVDPLTLIGKGVSGAVDALPQAADALAQRGGALGSLGTALSPVAHGTAEGFQAFTHGLRSTLGYLNPVPAVENLLRRASGASALTQGALGPVVEDVTHGTSDAERQAAWMAINNVQRGEDGTWSAIIPDAPPAEDAAAQTMGAVSQPAAESLLVKKAAQADAATPASITDQMANRLAQLGHTPEAIAQMDPGQARALIERGFGPTGFVPRRLTPMERALGLGGVAETEGGPVGDAAAADAAAAATRAQAVPADQLTASRYVSGVDAANKDLLGINAADPKTMPGLRKEVPADTAEARSVVAPDVPPVASRFSSIDDQIASWHQRIDALPGLTADQRAKAKVIAEAYGRDYGANTFKQAVDKGYFARPSGVNIGEQSPTDYAPRLYAGYRPEDQADMLGRRDLAVAGAGRQNIGKERTIGLGQDFADFLNKAQAEQPNFRAETDLLKGMISHVGQMGRMAERHAIAKGLVEEDLGEGVAQARAQAQEQLGKPLSDYANLKDPAAARAEDFSKYTTLQDPEMNRYVTQILGNLKTIDPDSWRRLSSAYAGMEPRAPVFDLLAKANRFFKGPAVYGFVIPKLNSIMRNVLGHPVQAASSPVLASVGGAGYQLAKTPETAWYVLNEGLRRAFGSPLAPGAVTKDYETISDAFKASGGDPDKALQILRGQGKDDLALALQHKVIGENFVDKDKIVNTLTNSSWGRKLINALPIGDKGRERAFEILDAPPAMFKASEDFARLQDFRYALQKGLTPQAAAKSVLDAYYDYGTYSKANRTLRDIIPFAGFSTQAIRAFGGHLSRNPGFGVALNAVYNQPDEGPVYPYVKEQMHIPMGQDAAGNPLYSTGFGMPWEALKDVPTPTSNLRELGEDLRRNVVAASSPAIKTAYGLVTGRDPYFDTHYGEYTKMPVVGDAGQLGAAYNMLAGTGLIQNIDTPLKYLDHAVDGDKTAVQRVLDLLTPVNLVSIDQRKAAQQMLEKELAGTPGVGVRTSYVSDDPRTRELIRQKEAVGRQLAKDRGQKPSK